jgi:hypothetical protein
VWRIISELFVIKLHIDDRCYNLLHFCYPSQFPSCGCVVRQEGTCEDGSPLAGLNDRFRCWEGIVIFVGEAAHSSPRSLVGHWTVRGCTLLSMCSTRLGSRTSDHKGMLYPKILSRHVGLRDIFLGKLCNFFCLYLCIISLQFVPSDHANTARHYNPEDHSSIKAFILVLWYDKIVLSLRRADHSSKESYHMSNIVQETSYVWGGQGRKWL